jgi:hypothetical protein
VHGQVRRRSPRPAIHRCCATLGHGSSARRHRRPDQTQRTRRCRDRAPAVDRRADTIARIHALNSHRHAPAVVRRVASCSLPGRASSAERTNGSGLHAGRPLYWARNSPGGGTDLDRDHCILYETVALLEGESDRVLDNRLQVAGEVHGHSCGGRLISPAPARVVQDPRRLRRRADR